MINTSDITNQSSKDSEKINLSSSIQEQKPFVKPPPIQNLNNLIMSCVKNDEYCYSMFDYLKKMIYFRQIDYLFAYTNILYCFRPKEINEMAKVRKHLKNKYARDDPGFLLIIIINLFISSIAFPLRSIIPILSLYSTSSSFRLLLCYSLLDWGLLW